jgi:ABC-type nitrate/sulfonate/bicarbonate transport system permease component
VLAFARAVPPPILVPVFLVLFKIGPQMEVFTIAFGTAWPILLHAMDGARSVEPLTMDVARIFHTPWYRRFLRVVLPAAAPRVFAGLRVSLSIGFILMIVSELVGVTSGIGYQLTYAEANGDLLQVWAWIVLVSALGYLANSALVVVEHRVLRGRRGATNQLGG